MISKTASGDTAHWVSISGFSLILSFIYIFNQALISISSLKTFFSAQIKSYRIFRGDYGNFVKSLEFVSDLDQLGPCSFTV